MAPLPPPTVVAAPAATLDSQAASALLADPAAIPMPPHSIASTVNTSMPTTSSAAATVCFTPIAPAGSHSGQGLLATPKDVVPLPHGAPPDVRPLYVPPTAATGAQATSILARNSPTLSPQQRVSQLEHPSQPMCPQMNLTCSPHHLPHLKQNKNLQSRIMHLLARLILKQCSVAFVRALRQRLVLPRQRAVVLEVLVMPIRRHRLRHCPGVHPYA